MILGSNHSILHDPRYVIIANRGATSYLIIICSVEQLAVAIIDTCRLFNLRICQSLNSRQLALVIGIAGSSAGREGDNQEKQEDRHRDNRDTSTCWAGLLQSLTALAHQHSYTHRVRAFPGF